MSYNIGEHRNVRALRRLLAKSTVEEVWRLAEASKEDFNWVDPQRCFTGIMSGGRSRHRLSVPFDDPDNEPAAQETLFVPFAVGRYLARRELRRRIRAGELGEEIERRDEPIIRPEREEDEEGDFDPLPPQREPEPEEEEVEVPA